VSRKNRNIGSTTRKNVPVKKDIYDVKENLKKLKSGTGKESYSTESTPFNDKSANEYYSTRHQDDNSMYSTTTTADRFERINDKFSSDISVLKDVITDHKEKITEKLNEKIDKSEFKFWISSAVGLILLISSIIYTLSYQEIVTDTKDLKENQNEINRHLDKVDFKIEQIEKKVDNKNSLTIQETK
jgi:hypothetical protein